MSDVSQVIHLLPSANEGFISTLGSTISSGATSVPLTNITGLVNGTTFVGIIEPGADKEQVFTGTVDTGGSQIIGVVWTKGSNASHSGGVTIVDYITGTAFNMLSRAMGVEHNDDGTHSAITASSIATDSLTIAGKDASQLTPTGVIVPFAGATPPTTWLLCDGSAVSRTTYSVLFGVIGTAYGTGDGTTTFNVPDGRGKAMVGYDSSQTEFNALGKAGGEKTHTLSQAEMPSHYHSANPPSATTSSDGSHNHSVGPLGSSGSYGIKDGPASSSGTGYTSTGGSHTHSVNIGSFNTGSAGSGSAHNNLQPYVTANYIIKA